MSLTAFTRIGEYTLPTITGSHTDFVVLLRYDDFIAGVLSKLDDGGGDLRFSSDAAGSNQLPCEVVTFDKVGGTAEVWVKVPSAATGTVIHIWGDNTGASQPAVTDPFGRNAVWSDYHRVFHLSESANTVSGGYADSTGDGSATGVSMTLPNVPNVWGRDTAQLDGSGDFLQSAISLSDDAAGVTLSGWAKVDSLATDSRLLSLSDLTTTSGTSSTRGPLIWMDEGGSGDGWAIIDKAGGISPNTSDNNATTDWQYIVAYFSSSAMRLYVDGTQTQSFGSTGIDLSVNPYLKIGRIWNESGYFDGGISNVKVVAGDYSGRVSTEYSNQSAVGAWGTMTDVGGTGGVTGSGNHQSQPATSSGTGSREVKGSGTHSSQSATSSGTGTVGGGISGSGNHQSQPATSSGTGFRAIKGSGVGDSQAATSSGTGTREIKGSGNHSSQEATSSGTGGIVEPITGSGNHTSQPATSSGTGFRIIKGSGNHQSQPATSFGTNAQGLPKNIKNTRAVEITKTYKAVDISELRRAAL